VNSSSTQGSDDILVRLYDPTCGLGVGALDYFDLGSTSASSAEIEKWWCIGDVRNRVGMWIQGRRV
jgi:guanine deaminase